MKKVKIPIGLNIILFLFFCLTPIRSFAGDSIETRSRIEALEKNEENIRLLYESRTEKLQLDYQKHKNDLEDASYLNTIIILIFGSLSIVGIVIGYFSVYFKAKKYANEKIIDSVEKIITEKKEKIIKLIKSIDEEYKLKTESKIIVISSDKGNEDFLKLFFSKNEFTKVDFLKTQDVSNHENYDMIFFNNEEGDLGQSEIDKYTQAGNQVFLTFSKSRIDACENMNCSNSRITLYSNVINTLRYHKVLNAH